MQYTLSIKLKKDGKNFFGPGPMRLLMLINRGDSLKQAAEKLGMAYSKAWRIIHEAEKALGVPLLDRQRGGSGGGGSVLTDAAKNLLLRYEQFQNEMYQLGNHLFQKHFGEFHSDSEQK